MPPVDYDRIRDSLLPIFLAEIDRRVGSMAANLAMLDGGVHADDAGEIYEALVRDAHTLKGTGGTMGFEDVYRASKALEASFRAVQGGELILDPSLRALLAGAVDALQDTSARLRAGLPVEGAALERVLPDLEQLAETLPPVNP